MWAAILLHADVALSDIKGALLWLCEMIRGLHLAEGSASALDKLKKKKKHMMLAGIVSVCSVCVAVVMYCYQKFSDKQSIALNILTKNSLRGLGSICTFR